ncbi:hypothetical protein CONCODRAFT_3864 [Conidiobolus coronatus NRRL 28638]|uniref:Uncharacterized protein n=1 Tax=Conidiobolus coronatus (strain ATCC 28846 / CBS 209.66 / NRRL 28638) TaxID=796925 RepID=A0A137PDW9_CONC2|nr:hypothetical protein CONCODRAFT_3864 [Conidiobolus coronatus NRRL 28638]|eukprot:KXN73196.1 hypothetical protein CONCODRAFT_3864 [Conidiobolus coronatus NRRL 28638]
MFESILLASRQPMYYENSARECQAREGYKGNLYFVKTFGNFDNIPNDIDQLPEWEPPFAVPPKQWLEEIASGLKVKSVTIGPHTTVTNEAQKKQFIDPFVDKLLSGFGGIVTNSAEETIVSSKSQFCGKTEYILKAFKKCIIIILEAKYSIQAAYDYGQVMVELYSIYQYNKSIGLIIPTVYGVLTDTSSWGWWRYDGKNFMDAKNNDEAEEALNLLKKNIPQNDISTVQNWTINYDSFINEISEMKAEKG